MSRVGVEGLMEKSHKLIKKVGLLERAKGALHPFVNQMFFLQLLQKTGNFSSTKWMGQTIRQNVLDLWVIQETIAEVRPELLIETGTNYGGSALFYAHLFDLIGRGRVITVDVTKLHDITHPRVDFLIGFSTSDEIMAHVRGAARAATGPVMVILDSDHSKQNVSKELCLYAPLVTPGSYVLVQDGMMDTMPVMRNGDQPGPLPAIREFVRDHPEFEVDREKCEKFLITHHPEGWLKRKG